MKNEDLYCLELSQRKNEINVDDGIWPRYHGGCEWELRASSVAPLPAAPPMSLLQ